MDLVSVSVTLIRMAHGVVYSWEKFLETNTTEDHGIVIVERQSTVHLLYSYKSCWDAPVTQGDDHAAQTFSQGCACSRQP